MSPQDTQKIADPIEMEVFTNRLLSITEDMNNTLVRSSFSTNIKERKDCSVALFDAAGRLVAQGTQIPLHLGSLNGAVRSVLAQYPAERIAEGDVFICNDPYLANGSHLPDINIVTPVFWEGTLRFFTANIAHHSDVGGSVPGSIAGGLRSIFEEGIRIPVARLAQAGVLQEDLLRLVCANTRDPEERQLDLKVQMATNQRGADAVLGLIRQMGLPAVLRSVDDVINYTRRRLANRIAELRQGSYTFSGEMDDDGLGGDPVRITVTLTVDQGRLKFDFTGSSRQARGAMNLPINALHATVYYAACSTGSTGTPPGAPSPTRSIRRRWARAPSPRRRWPACCSGPSAALCRPRRPWPPATTCAPPSSSPAGWRSARASSSTWRPWAAAPARASTATARTACTCT